MARVLVIVVWQTNAKEQQLGLLAMRSIYLGLWLTHKQLLDLGKTTSPSFLRSEMAQVK